MSETTRFGLPFILPGQAQKEVFHNEALARIDAVLHPAVEGAPLAAPPAGPVEGQAWIVAAGASGDWAGRDAQLAAWTQGGWRYIAPQAGLQVWSKSAGTFLRHDGSGWSNGEVETTAIVIGGAQVVGQRQPAVPSPSGGTTIDAEARAALAAVIAALMSHGLID